jgi:hypothetical protein
MDETNKNDAPESSRRGMRFSIGQLLVVTAIVSVVLMVLVTLAPPLWSLAVASPSTKSFFDTLFGPFFGSGISQEYGRRIPLYLVWAIGAVLLERRWKQHPRVSLCALAGLTGLLLLELIGVGLTLSMYYRMQAQVLSATVSPQAAMPGTPMPIPPLPSLSPTASETLLIYYRYVRPVAAACCWALILTAVLGWRGNAVAVDAKNA